MNSRTRQDQVTIRVWVSNQVVDHDETAAYIEGSGWTPRSVVYDPATTTLTGSRDEIQCEFEELRAVVASGGRGFDFEGNPIPGRPELVIRD